MNLARHVFSTLPSEESLSQFSHRKPSRFLNLLWGKSPEVQSMPSSCQGKQPALSTSVRGGGGGKDLCSAGPFFSKTYRAALPSVHSVVHSEARQVDPRRDARRYERVFARPGGWRMGVSLLIGIVMRLYTVRGGQLNGAHSRSASLNFFHPSSFLDLRLALSRLNLYRGEHRTPYPSR